MWQTVGHEWVVELLQRAIREGRLGHAYLITGPSSVGKSLLATEFAAALNCSAEAPPCGECASCRRTLRGTHPDVTLVHPDGERLKIDQVRALQYELSLSPREGRRVCLIYDFEKATTEAANALLKTLEEPPPKVVILLMALDAALLLPTIVSRCQHLPLRQVSSEQIEEHLVRRLGLEPDRARLLARLSGGRIGWAIAAAQEPALLAEREERLAELVGLLDVGHAARIRAAEKLASSAELPRIIALWQTWWRDVMLVAAGCEELVTNVDAMDTLRLHASRRTVVEAERAMREAGATLVRLQQNVNARLATEVLLLGW